MQLDPEQRGYIITTPWLEKREADSPFTQYVARLDKPLRRRADVPLAAAIQALLSLPDNAPTLSQQHKVALLFHHAAASYPYEYQPGKLSFVNKFGITEDEAQEAKIVVEKDVDPRWKKTFDTMVGINEKAKTQNLLEPLNWYEARLLELIQSLSKDTHEAYTFPFSLDETIPCDMREPADTVRSIRMSILRATNHLRDMRIISSKIGESVILESFQRDDTCMDEESTHFLTKHFPQQTDTDETLLFFRTRYLNTRRRSRPHTLFAEYLAVSGRQLLRRQSTAFFAQAG